MSGFLDEARYEQDKAPRGAQCDMGKLKDKDPSTYEGAIECCDQRITFAATSRALSARGHKVAAGTISRHYKGMCACQTS